ncbi:MAG TPA: undecaprenyl-diphosphate phosphatase, partial [Pyrinomonadaceae bacterium]|nr:undecaprenyl-diphosphate phosphatase [Pyrinomonadaceae bacterium]
MTILQAIVLGVVQGLTEFIPVSSTAHLVFAARVVNLYGGADKTLQAEQTTATIAVIQLGTLLAVLVYFTRDIVNILRAFVRDHLAWMSGNAEPGRPKLSSDAWLGWLVIIGSIPVGIVGLLFKKQIEGPLTKNLWVIATMMIVVGGLLTIAEFVGKRDRGMDRLGIKDALAVGTAQVLALLPGSSRSGSTIMGGLFAGQTR